MSALWLTSSLQPSTGHAQSTDAAVRLDGLQPAAAPSPYVRSEGLRPSFDEGVALSARLIGDYGYQPLKTRISIGGPTSTNETSDKNIVEHATLLHLGGSLSVLDWLVLEANFPVAIYEKGEADNSVVGQTVAAGKAGIGDMRLGILFLPTNTANFDVGFGARGFAASGSQQAYLRDRDALARLEAVAYVAARNGALNYACTTSVSPLFFTGRNGDRVALSCALGAQLAPAVRAFIEPHAALYTFRSALGSRESMPGLGEADLALGFEPMAGFHIDAGAIGIGLFGGVGLGGAPGVPVARGALSLSYTVHSNPIEVELPPPDRDVDGVPDLDDACPDQAGPKDRRGCPSERDLDGDGFLTDDACPTQSGLRHTNPRANGCPDTDNDYLPDPIDKCPAEPGSKSDGCPRYARLAATKFEVKPRLRFVRLRSMLTAESLAALSEILATTRVTPSIRKLKVVIGAGRVNRRLTKKRAQQVERLLKDTGFEQRRFEVITERRMRGGSLEVRIERRP